MKEHILLTEMCKVIVFAVPTMVSYFAICYSPRMTAKLVGTAVSDFLTNILYGIVISMFRNSYEIWFQIVILVLMLIMLFIKFHCGRIFILQLTETPTTRDFHDTVRNSLGRPPVVKIMRVPKDNQAREMSPIYFDYDSWQDLTPFPELKNSDCLKVTTATNCCFTRNAQKQIYQKITDLQRKYPNDSIEISTSSPDSTCYFLANSYNKKTNKLNILKSKPAVLVYYIGVLLGYRLWFEYMYFSSVQEVKVSMTKCIGVKEDNLRASKNETDKIAQENFTLYCRAADKQKNFSRIV